MRLSCGDAPRESDRERRMVLEVEEVPKRCGDDSLILIIFTTCHGS